MAKAQETLKALALQKTKRLAATVARLKYTPLHQRTQEYESRPTKRMRAAVERSFLGLSRLSPAELTRALVEDGLLPDLEGAPCPNLKCEQQTCGYGSRRVLGKLSASREVDTTVDVLSRENVSYRCQACRCRVPVTRGVPLFENCTWPSLALLAFWNCLEGVDITTTVQQLSVCDDLVRRWHQATQVIMAEDALQRQGRIKFGCRGTSTTDVEADETCFFSWR